MKITLTWKNGLLLAAMAFIMQETHELAHTATGRLLCGCWGARDFNHWQLCKGCDLDVPLLVLPTLAGPIYTFGIIWIGYVLLGKASVSTKSVGLALVVSSMTFSRILTPLFGGGDTIFALKRLGMEQLVAWPVVLTLVLALTVPPVVRIYRMIDNRRKGIWIAGLLLLPFLLVGIIVFGLLQNTLLESGVLSDTWAFGSPALVTTWLLFCCAVVILLGKQFTTFLAPAAE